MSDIRTDGTFIKSETLSPAEKSAKYYAEALSRHTSLLAAFERALRITDELKSQFGVDLPVSYVAIDRSKQQPSSALKDKHVQKVATFIYYRGDAELGRIVEKTQSPLFEDDLLSIVARQ